MMKFSKTKIVLFSILTILLISCISFGIYVSTFFNITECKELSLDQFRKLDLVKKEKFPNEIISYPEYTISNSNEIYLNASSGILINYETGSILYEKNADEIIPPASMTKLVVIYTILKEVEAGNISLTDIVPLPPESWAINAPPQSSLMFLAEGDVVTLDDLILGMAVMSGNDAAVACACYISGSVEKFIQRMNQEVLDIGLINTRFVDSSGYSENNQTTPRDFVKFVRTYIKTFPETIEKYHSKKQMVFKGITFNSTNKVLGKVLGLDGLKTGFIYESGYNYALTCKRENSRIIGILMGGPGLNSIEGTNFRIQDTIQLTDWYYNNFENVSFKYFNYIMKVFEGQENTLQIKSAYTPAYVTVLKNSGEVRILKEIPEYLKAPVKAGDKIGELKYYMGDTLVQTVPLIADRDIEKGNIFKKTLDKLTEKVFNLLK